ncbi:class I SAM-dependent methyltransferase [Amycolatopsis sp. NPDC051903]|uniref:class I SAM-dependent methyltransferase n=1 Tax=Amycolatopsis sp. NPDC051903 TaxID=3363936 RepID=UPI003787AA61
MTEPSFTALTAAAARAAHLVVDADPKIFTDDLAAPLLGGRAGELLAYHREHGDQPVLAGARTQVLVRSRYTEAQLGGLTQYVLLGAGLDTYAYRARGADVRVFEVDRPETQAWKRAQLARNGIPAPASVAYVPLDLESGDLVAALIGQGFDVSRPALVGWLGVTMYLTRPAIARTLAVLGGFAPGSQLVADYFLLPQLRDEAGASYAGLVAPVAAQRGEPWLSCFSPESLTDLLRDNGFGPVRHVRQHDHDVWPRTDALRPAGLSVLAHATVA